MYNVQYTLIEVKCGLEEPTAGRLFNAKFHLDQCKGVIMVPPESTILAVCVRNYNQLTYWLLMCTESRDTAYCLGAASRIITDRNMKFCEKDQVR